MNKRPEASEVARNHTFRDLTGPLRSFAGPARHQWGLNSLQSSLATDAQAAQSPLSQLS